jgi:hypothetical protein
MRGRIDLPAEARRDVTPVGLVLLAMVVVVPAASAATEKT